MLDILGCVGYKRTDCFWKQKIDWDQGWLAKKVWALTLTWFPSMRTARAKDEVFTIKWKLLCINYTIWSFETTTYTQTYNYLINNKTVLYTRHEKALKQNPLKSPMSPDVSLICAACETESLNLREMLPQHTHWTKSVNRYFCMKPENVPTIIQRASSQASSFRSVVKFNTRFSFLAGESHNIIVEWK